MMKNTNESKNRSFLKAALLLLPLLCFCAYKFQSRVNCNRANLESITLQYPGILSAIAYTPKGNSLIMLDDQLVFENTSVNGFTIKKVWPDRIELEKDNQTWIAALSQGKTPNKSDHYLSQPQYPNYQHDYSSQMIKQYQQLRQQAYSNPMIAENGSYYSEISQNTGRPKTVYVHGYYRKDGTYVSAHYRSRPRR